MRISTSEMFDELLEARIVRNDEQTRCSCRAHKREQALNGGFVQTGHSALIESRRC
jgi:hypothetical protein